MQNNTLRKGWIANNKTPWVIQVIININIISNNSINVIFNNKNNNSLDGAKEPDAIELPNSEWCWASNWKIDKKIGHTDNEGWEYATNMNRFMDTDRVPVPDPRWNDKVRRRLWTRVMRREAQTNFRERTTSKDMNKLLPKIQAGLKCIHESRVRIEEIMMKAPEAAETEEMQNLIQSVKANIKDIYIAVDQADNQATVTHTAVIKKLRNDLIKEELAIDKVLIDKDEPKVSTKTITSKKYFGLGKAKKVEEKTEVKVEDIPPPMAPVLSSGVTGGRGAFNPSILAPPNNGAPSWAKDDVDDGIFVDRTMHELIIEQRLKAIDEATIMQEIVNERNEEITKVHKGLVEINEMFVDLSKIVKHQQAEIDRIFDNVDDSNARAKEAFDNIVNANRLQKTGNCILS